MYDAGPSTRNLVGAGSSLPPGGRAPTGIVVEYSTGLNRVLKHLVSFILLSTVSLSAQEVATWDLFLPTNARYSFVNAETGELLNYTDDGVSPFYPWRLKFSTDPGGTTLFMDIFIQSGNSIRVLGVRRFTPDQRVENAEKCSLSGLNEFACEVSRQTYFLDDGSAGIPLLPEILHEGQSGTIVSKGTYTWEGLWDWDTLRLYRNGPRENLERVHKTGTFLVQYTYSYALGRLHIEEFWQEWEDDGPHEATALRLYIYDERGMIAMGERSGGEPGIFYVRGE